MSYLHRIADKLAGRRVTFARPRPPQPTDAQEIADFTGKNLPVRFLVGAVIIGTLLAAVGLIALLVAFVSGAFD
jgi:hypothetical protein